MEKHVSQEITQPSDLFGREILSECTFESEYGKLTLGRVVVPDFSSDEKGSVRLKEEFSNLKAFIGEKDLSRKLGIAERFRENEFYASRSSRIFSKFACTLIASTRARAFEFGIDLSPDICIEFGYDQNANLSSGMLHYNDISVVQPFACAGGVYAYCLKYVLNPDIFCPQDYRDLKNEILNNGIPTHNYLSWAFSCASDNKNLISFVSVVHLCLC